MFGHTEGEIKKKTYKKYIRIQTRGETQNTIIFGGKLSFILSFFFLSAYTATTYIFTPFT
jgi:hypothetical protein